MIALTTDSITLAWKKVWHFRRAISERGARLDVIELQAGRIEMFCSVRLARDGSSAITYKILFSKLNETRGREQRETRASAENEGHLIDIGNCTNFNKEDESEGEQGCSSGEHVDAVAQEGPHEPGPSVRKKTDSKKWRVHHRCTKKTRHWCSGTQAGSVEQT